MIDFFPFIYLQATLTSINKLLQSAGGFNVKNPRDITDNVNLLRGDRLARSLQTVITLSLTFEQYCSSRFCKRYIRDNALQISSSIITRCNFRCCKCGNVAIDFHTVCEQFVQILCPYLYILWKVKLSKSFKIH